MKTLGLIGGISSFSTSVYYTTINHLINERLGDSNSAQLILYSINFNEYKIFQENGDWLKIEVMLTHIAEKLENAGANCILICSNTPHLIADSLRKKIKIPLLHIAEETAKEIVKHKLKKVGLIGTKFTMENSFFIEKLSSHGIKTLIPENEDRALIHTSIIEEFTKGIYTPETKKKYLAIIEKLRQKGAEAIVFGCTEIILLLQQKDCEIKIFDTTAIHCKAAVDFALHLNKQI